MKTAEVGVLMLRVIVTLFVFERSRPRNLGNDRFGYGSGTVARVSVRCKEGRGEHAEKHDSAKQQREQLLDVLH